jgi:hypothetical protein
MKGPTSASTSGSGANVSAGALAAGGGSGGILVYIFNNYVTDSKLQGLLVYLAPTLSIFITGVYAKAMRRYEDWQKEIAPERKRKALLKRAESNLKGAKKQLDSIEKDPESTPEHKKQARDHVEGIERAILNLHSEGIVSLVLK